MALMFRHGEIRPEFGYIKVGFVFLDLAILLGLILSAACAALAVYVLVVAYCSDFWVLLVSSLLTFVLSLTLYKYLRAPFLRKFSEASKVLASGREESAVLRFPGVTGWSGTLVERISAPAARNVILSIGAPKWFKPPKGDFDTVLKSDQNGKISTVVIKSGKHFLVGVVRSLSDMRLEFLRMRKLLVSLLVLALASALAIAAFITVEAYRLSDEITRARASVDFPTTEAHIIRSQVVETKVRRGKALLRAWRPAVEYAYSMDGEYHTGYRLTPAAQVYFDKSLAQHIASKYQQNAIHQLYYDPADPAFAVLEPGNDHVISTERTSFLVKWLAILVAVLAIAALMQLLRRRLLPQISDLTERVYGSRKRGHKSQ